MAEPKVVRYNPLVSPLTSQMHPLDHGEWVSYSDYEALANEHNRLHGKYGEALAKKSQLAARVEELEVELKSMYFNCKTARDEADRLREAIKRVADEAEFMEPGIGIEETVLAALKETGDG